MTARAERDDARTFTRRRQRVVEAVGESEVAEMVRRELKLPAGRCQPQLGYRHHPSVVDQDVERSAPARDEGRDRVRLGQIERPDVYGRIARRRGDLRGGLGSGSRVSDGERDLRACGRECPGRLDPDPRRAAGHDRALPGQVGARDDLGRRGVEPERCRDEGRRSHPARSHRRPSPPRASPRPIVVMVTVVPPSFIAGLATERAARSRPPLGQSARALGVGVAAAATAGRVLHDLVSGRRNHVPRASEGIDTLAVRLTPLLVLGEHVEGVVVVRDL